MSKFYRNALLTLSLSSLMFGSGLFASLVVAENTLFGTQQSEDFFAQVTQGGLKVFLQKQYSQFTGTLHVLISAALIIAASSGTLGVALAMIGTKSKK